MTAVKREYPDVKVLGELFDGDPALLAYYQGGRAGHDGIDTRLDTLYDFALFYPLRRAFAEGKQVRDVSQMLAHDFLYPNPDVLVTFIGVHDMLRFMSEKGATTDGLKLAQTFIMTTRGTPLLYYGDEIAMAGGGDPDNRRDFPGGFSGDARNAFTKEGRSNAEQEVFEHVSRLGRLRAELEPLRRGRSLDLLDAEQQMAYARMTDRATVIVVFNNDTKPATVEFDVAEAGIADGAQMSDRLGVSPEARVESGKLRVTLPARRASIFTVK
jgi:glycosidase